MCFEVSAQSLYNL